MVMYKTQINSKCTVNVSCFGFMKVHTFKHPGILITWGGRCIKKMRTEKGQTKTAFYEMKNILCHQFQSLEVKKRVLACFIEPGFTYGYKAWTIGLQANKSLDTEMLFYRRMLKITGTATISNTNVLNEAETQKQPTAIIRKRQYHFLAIL